MIIKKYYLAEEFAFEVGSATVAIDYVLLLLQHFVGDRKDRVEVMLLLLLLKTVMVLLLVL